MRSTPRIAGLLAALVLVATLAGPLAAAGPELISSRPFDVRYENGVVTANFTLIMSEVPSYPVTITAMCCSAEEVLYEGTLSEGVYRISAPLTKLKGRGELQVVLRTRITNRSEGGNQSYIVYLKWRGTM